MSISFLLRSQLGPQDLGGLLSNPRAANTSFALDIMGWMILLPSAEIALSPNPEHQFMMRNKRVCHQILRLSAVMEELIVFLVRNSTLNPQSDMEWMAVKGRRLLSNLHDSVEDGEWMFDFLPEDRCAYNLCVAEP